MHYTMKYVAFNSWILYRYIFAIMQLEFLQMKVLYWTILCASQSMMVATQKFKLLHYEDYQILWFFGQWGLQVTKPATQPTASCGSTRSKRDIFYLNPKAYWKTTNVYSGRLLLLCSKVSILFIYWDNLEKMHTKPTQVQKERHWFP